MRTSPCYQCGYCCTVSPCAVGEWDPDKKQCRFLTDNTECAKYSEIVEKEKDSMTPMMGCGCSSPLLNEIRAKKMIELGLDPIKEQEEINAEFGLDFGENFATLWERIQ